MRQFWRDVWYEFTRMGPRMIYFLKTGQIHPELRTEYGIWPKYTIVGSPSPAGSFSVHYNGESVTYTSDLKMMVGASDPGVDWALRWANHE